MCLFFMYSQIEPPTDVPADVPVDVPADIPAHEEVKDKKKKVLSYLLDCVDGIFRCCGFKK